jgi:DNA-binding MarR family transcriptional regulator
MVSISKEGVKLMASVAPFSEAIYAEITQRFGARKLAELQEMLGQLELCLASTAARDEVTDET